MPMTTGGSPYVPGNPATNTYSTFAHSAWLGTVSSEYFTVCVWHRWITAPALNSGYAYIISLRAQNGNNPRQVILEGGSAGSGTWGTRLKSVGLQTWNGGYSAAVNTGTDDIVEGQWYHYAIVGDGANGTKAYQDGVEVLSNTNTLIGIGEVAFIRSPANEYSTQPADGQIAHAKMWDAALTQADIAREMATGAPVRLSNIKCWRPHLDDTSDYLGIQTYSTTHNGTFGGSVQVAQRSQQPIIVEIPAEDGPIPPVTVDPSNLAMTVATYGASVTVTDNTTLTPASVALGSSFSGASVAITENIGLTPGLVTLGSSFSGALVAISDNIGLTPGSVALGSSFFDSSISLSDNKTTTPPPAPLGGNLFTPWVSITSGSEITPGTVALGASGFSAAVEVSDNKTVTPDTLELLLVVGINKVVTPDTATLVTSPITSIVVLGNVRMINKVSPTGLDLDELSITHLMDTPATFGSAGQVLTVNATSTGLLFAEVTGSGTTAFVDLTDGPLALGTAGQYVAMNGGANALEFIAPPTIPTVKEDFYSLNDTPANYTGSAGQVVRVNAAENALEFVAHTELSRSFIGLSDTPDNYTGASTKYLQYSGDSGEIIFTDVNNSVNPALISFHSLANTPTQAAVNNGKYLRQKADNSFDTEWVSVSGGTSTLLGLSDTPTNYGSAGQYLKVSAAGDGFNYANPDPHAPVTVEVTSHEEVVTTGTNKHSFRMPYAANLLGVRASVVTAPTGTGGLVVNIRAVGETTNTSIFGTNKLTIDDGETTSTTSTTTPTIAVEALADDILIQIDADTAAGSPAGLKITLLLD